MRARSKAVLLAVAALALSGITAAAASAEPPPEWLLNEAPVTTSTPVTDTATGFTINRQEEGDQGAETVTCALSGKGTVNAKGAGTITAWNETSCRGVGGGGFECEAGTVSASGAKLPWTTQLALTTEVSDVNNRVNGFELTWQCQAKWLGTGPKLFKVTCSDSFVSNWLETTEKGLGEGWNWIPSAELRCVRTWGSVNYGSGDAVVRGNFTLLKGEKGTLSYNK